MTENLEEQIGAVIARYHMIGVGERVLAGVSGGADSVCLFSALCALREKVGFFLEVVHVDHGMREEAAEDAAFVRRLAGERSVPFHLKRVDVPSLQRMWRCSPEDAARRARYGAFAEVLRETGAERLALAHNRGDQAETVLFKLFRGAGLRGFAGMAPVRPLTENAADVLVIRPLLFTPRRAIEAYLSEKGLAHREDASNAGDAYARNRLRRQLLPWVGEQINAEAERHLAEAAERAREALVFAEAEAQRRYRGLRLESDEAAAGAPGRLLRPAAAADPSGKRVRCVTLNAALLRREEPFMQKEILFTALREAGASHEIGAAHIGALLRLIAAADGARSLDLPGGCRAVREYDSLRIEARPAEGKGGKAAEAGAGGERRGDRICPVPAASGGEQTIPLAGAGAVRIAILEKTPGAQPEEIPADPFTKWFDSDKIKKPLCFRTRRAGDWIDVGSGRRTLKKEMIDRKLPAALRDGIWLLAADSEILWIVGGRRCEAYKVDAETRHILQMRLLRDGECPAEGAPGQEDTEESRHGRTG